MEEQSQSVIVLCVHFAAMTHVTALCPFQSIHGPLQCDQERDQHPYLPHPLCRGGERTRRPRVLEDRLVTLHSYTVSFRWKQFSLTKSGLSCLNLATRESRVE